MNWIWWMSKRRKNVRTITSDMFSFFFFTSWKGHSSWFQPGSCSACDRCRGRSQVWRSAWEVPGKMSSSAEKKTPAVTTSQRHKESQKQIRVFLIVFLDCFSASVIDVIDASARHICQSVNLLVICSFLSIPWSHGSRGDSSGELNDHLLADCVTPHSPSSLEASLRRTVHHGAPFKQRNEHIRHHQTSVDWPSNHPFIIIIPLTIH